MRWRAAYEAMCFDAIKMGIPSDVLPKVHLKPSLQEVLEATDHLQGMMLSFLSSAL
jgi:hypothetical protein